MLIVQLRTAFFLLLIGGGLYAADPTPEGIQFFESKIRPILSQKCYKCHSVEQGKSKGKLTVDSKDAILKGGETGPAITPGDPENSLLIKAVSYADSDLQMPPKGEKLSEAEIADLSFWVKMGAPDPRAVVGSAKLSGLTEKSRSHWAYQPIKKYEIPTPKNAPWCVTQIDSFVLAKLEEKGMTPSPQATKEALLRRATYDLTGLPPTLREIDAFVADSAPDAYLKVVDRLLASRRYGERWGRFWLDTARYSDTTGVRSGNSRNDYRLPYAWTYRDWVIQAFNDNMPYDQFILQQLSADRIAKNPPENLAALGFLTVGERFPNQNDIINDRIDVVSKGFLATTVVCARCHDHMFDPVPTKDYYSLHGIFASTIEPSEKPILHGTNPKLQAEFEAKLAALEATNRASYYKVIGEVTATFQKRSALYIMAAHLSRNGASEDELKRGEMIAVDEKLDRNIKNEIRGRMGRKDDDIFGPFACFNADKESWGAISEKVTKDKKYNFLIRAAFKAAQPTSYDDLVNLYQRIFDEGAKKTTEIIVAYASAKQTVPRIKRTNEGVVASTNDGAMMEMEPSMMGMTSIPDSDVAKGSKPVKQDPALTILAVFPFKIFLASELNTEGLRNATRAWQPDFQNRGKFGYSKINELLLTDPGAPVRAMVVADAPHPRDSPVFIRGQADVRGAIEPRHFLSALSKGSPQPFKNGSGRLELAHCIASKENPLTARVIVNRVWMHHFGQGFVRTPDDLGTQSEAPSHPELLDYLSWWLMNQEWDLKKLHKLIMLSRVYQESSYTVSEHEVIDPDNRYLWRANIRRLDFESMRDSLLFMAGRLDFTSGGQPVNLTDEPFSYRRSVYGYIDRGNLPELMTHFDFSNPDMPNSARSTTVVPQQALFLMNDPMAVDVARNIVNRPDVKQAENNTRGVLNLYKIIFGRSPTRAEFSLGAQFLSEEAKQQPGVNSRMREPSKKAQEQAKKKADDRAKSENAEKAIQNVGTVVSRAALDPWEAYAHALLMSNEAVYVD